MESKYVSELVDRKSFNKNLNVISNLDLLKASGPNCILMVVLKNCEPQLSYVLDHLFNMCLQEFFIPDCWKALSVVPVLQVYQKKPQNLVCLFSVVTKIANNRFVDPLENVVFFISSIILSLTDQLRILCI